MKVTDVPPDALFQGCAFFGQSLLQDDETVLDFIALNLIIDLLVDELPHMLNLYFLGALFFEKIRETLDFSRWIWLRLGRKSN